MPREVRIGGVVYVEVTLHVGSKDVFSRPKGCTLMYEDEEMKGPIANSSGEVLIVYVRRDMVKAVGKDTV